MTQSIDIPGSDALLPHCLLSCRDLLWIHSWDNRRIFNLWRQLNTIPPQSHVTERTANFLGKEGLSLKCRRQIAPVSTIWCSSRSSNFSQHNTAMLHEPSLVHCSVARSQPWHPDQTEEENLAGSCVGILVWKYVQRMQNYLKNRNTAPGPGGCQSRNRSVPSLL